MKRAFSVAELLIIVLVVAFITALVVPLVAGMENVYTAKCAANGKQIVNACLLYMAEYDGRFPSTVQAWPQSARGEIEAYLSSKTWQYTWADGTSWKQTNWNATMAQWRFVQLKKYIKDDSAWVCPYPRTMYSERYAYGWRINWLPRSSDNFINGDRGFCDGNGVGRTVEEVEMLDLKGETTCGSRSMPPHKKIIWMCYALGVWAANGRIGDGKFPWVFPSCSHEGGTNYAYVDGHVGWAQLGSSWAPVGYTTLQPDNDACDASSVEYSPRYKAAIKAGVEGRGER